MPAFLHVRLHLIWSTHNREPRLLSAWRGELHAYLHGICEHVGACLLLGGSVEDHVHCYVGIPATVSVADLVGTLKSNSSRWIRERFDPAFAWQTKYAAFSVSKSAEEQLFAYIRGQEKHHRRRSFREDRVEFLERHGMEYNPQYLLE